MLSHEHATREEFCHDTEAILCAVQLFVEGVVIGSVLLQRSLELDDLVRFLSADWALIVVLNAALMETAIKWFASANV